MQPSSPTAHVVDTGAMIARQAIVNGQQAVVGYELFNRSRTHHTAASDVVMVFTALSHAGSDELVGNLLLFVNCTHESLAGGHLDLVQPDKVVLEVPPLGHAAADEVQARLPMLQALRARGFNLAFDHSVLQSAYAPWLPLADYIKLDLSVLARDQLAVLVGYAGRNSHAELIAEKIESAQQYDMVSSLGVQLFQGYWFARPTLVRARVLAPSQATTMQLLNAVRSRADVDAIEEVLKRDASLSFNLLRLINAAGLGMAREVTSLRQAVMLLGARKLFRWAALLLTAVRNSSTPPALGQTAVVRARLMELLARQLQAPEDGDEAFVIGLFSMLDQMLGLPLAEAVALLNLPLPVTDALLLRQGPLGRLLALAEACEHGDAEAFNRLAASLALDQARVNAAHLQALAWADAVSP
ncbi:EAL and modified HD-GYP domain-containing signal transduction protein [Oryzisolibacter propanilivorax]|uniref:EAL and modified HD-GYP domain-containing signal transduction protein n=1 Tax=Oryzisolibacter propanilivorax TaxID=1527607 RepID=A0A1G9R853_9BURK|nr:HDOD domain-containing protein [Oryzisolibacter propanilivorax]SDM19418.1 EAL and modified HD-GYP domain-containing signal transduction protein [Oryzisolibacter propanilivorax]